MVEQSAEADVVLIGGGIMSATLGMLLKQVRPEWSITAFERLDRVGTESSWAWNNAGTGHAGLCELNYTPERPDGSIDTSKAVRVNEQFQVSCQFWSHLVERGDLPSPREFINPVPHMSYVNGNDGIAFLRKRYDALAGNPLFAEMQYSEDRAQFDGWVPLMMAGRECDAPVAMTRSELGTGVNYGATAGFLFSALESKGIELVTQSEADDLVRRPDGRWEVATRDCRTGERTRTTARFVFVGAGGYAVRLLQRSGIPEARGYGGFPVSGQFLRCANPDIIDRHPAKVYGKSEEKAPPMSMPHLDRREIDGGTALLFGPYAGFSPKFLKQGSFTDLFRSVRPHNILTMLNVARTEFGLTQYLIRQVMQSHEARIATLRDFVPTADADDWELIHAGQRVQIMKHTAHSRGELVFGTEVVTSADGSLAGLLGASPGASTSPSIMLDVLERCFPDEYPGWQSRLRDLIPSIGVSLADNPGLLEEVRRDFRKTLELEQPARVTA